MKAKRKNQPKQRRIALLMHTSFFLFGSAFYLVWWATSIPANNATMPQLIGFMLTWLTVLLLHTASVPFFRWAQMGQALWWRPQDYLKRHLWLDVNVATFMATFGLLDAWVVSQMFTPQKSPMMVVVFGAMLMLPLWLMGVLLHGHRVLVEDVEANQQTLSEVSSRLEDVSEDSSEDIIYEVSEQQTRQSSH